MNNEKRKRNRYPKSIGAQTLPWLCRAMPSAIELEEAVLGAIMLGSEFSGNLVKTVLMKIQPSHFYQENHQLICKAIKELSQQDFPVDILTVTEQCRRNGDLDKVGGPYHITQLTSRISSSANIDYWFRIIYQKYLLREMVRIGNEKGNLASMESVDCFDLLNDFISELEELDPSVTGPSIMNASKLSEEVMQDLREIEKQRKEGLVLPQTIYHLGWPRFDKVVSLGRDKIILIAGAAKSGKSKFIRAVLYQLLERFSDVSVCWISLEDSRQDLFRSYLASKIMVTAKQIKLHDYPREKLQEMENHSNRFKSFDIEFIDQTIKSNEVISHFVQFCGKRKDRFNILVVDNILSLDDQSDFKFDPNGFCNHVMQNLLKCRQKTRGLIFALHHFNDAQQDKENIHTGYRPVLKDMKGSETFRRTPNQVLLINSFNIYKDLMSEYSGDKRKVLSNLFIVDTGANREDRIDDEVALIHFFTDMAFDHFMEISLPADQDTSQAG